MSDTVKIKVSISTQKVGSECTDVIEFDRESWDAMSEEDKEQECQDAAFQMMEWFWIEEEK